MVFDDTLLYYIKCPFVGIISVIKLVVLLYYESILLFRLLKYSLFPDVIYRFINNMNYNSV